MTWWDALVALMLAYFVVAMVLAIALEWRRP